MGNPSEELFSGINCIWQVKLLTCRTPGTITSVWDFPSREWKHTRSTTFQDSLQKFRTLSEQSEQTHSHQFEVITNVYLSQITINVWQCPVWSKWEASTMRGITVNGLTSIFHAAFTMKTPFTWLVVQPLRLTTSESFFFEHFLNVSIQPLQHAKTIHVRSCWILWTAHHLLSPCWLVGTRYRALQKHWGGSARRKFPHPRCPNNQIGGPENSIVHREPMTSNQMIPVSPIWQLGHVGKGPDGSAEPRHSFPVAVTFTRPHAVLFRSWFGKRMCSLYFFPKSISNKKNTRSGSSVKKSQRAAQLAWKCFLTSLSKRNWKDQTIVIRTGTIWINFCFNKLGNLHNDYCCPKCSTSDTWPWRPKACKTFQLPVLSFWPNSQSTWVQIDSPRLRWPPRQRLCLKMNNGVVTRVFICTLFPCLLRESTQLGITFFGRGRHLLVWNAHIFAIWLSTEFIWVESDQTTWPNVIAQGDWIVAAISPFPAPNHTTKWMRKNVLSDSPFLSTFKGRDWCLYSYRVTLETACNWHKRTQKFDLGNLNCFFVNGKGLVMAGFPNCWLGKIKTRLSSKSHFPAVEELRQRTQRCSLQTLPGRCPGKQHFDGVKSKLWGPDFQWWSWHRQPIEKNVLQLKIWLILTRNKENAAINFR